MSFVLQIHLNGYESTPTPLICKAIVIIITAHRSPHSTQLLTCFFSQFHITILFLNVISQYHFSIIFFKLFLNIVSQYHFSKIFLNIMKLSTHSLSASSPLFCRSLQVSCLQLAKNPRSQKSAFNSKYSRIAFAFHQINLVCAGFYRGVRGRGHISQNLTALSDFDQIRRLL